MAYQILLVAALFILMYGVFAKRIEQSIFNGPIIAIVLGLLIGPLGLKIIQIDLDVEIYRLIAELALALVLFSDASKANLFVLKQNASLPIRLLFIGLPLTIVFGMAIGFMIFNDFSWIEIAILATMLAPTDAALGKAVVTNEAVPVKIRESLNTESGLNDGISVPVLFLFITLFVSTEINIGSFYGLNLFVKEIGIGLLAGVIITYTTFVLARYSNMHKWISESWKPIVVIALTIACFTAAQMSGGSGFIACFAGGFLYGTLNSKHQLEANLIESAEGAGDTMSLLTWLIFGAFVIPEFLYTFNWDILLYAVLSLTLIRMLPVFLSLINSGVSVKEKLFIGWFGPRGLATIVFAIIVLDVPLPHIDKIIETTIYTILLSVVLHGITANPFIKILNKK